MKKHPPLEPYSRDLPEDLWWSRGVGSPTLSVGVTATRRRQERDFFIDNLLVRIHLIVEMIKWTGLAPWEF